ncbi:MAG TPA: hypothetical protein ENK77_00345 [Epsilonproteobacteria bacterium]|nr:hypothetical protein [Campylobacterota bacterium]
MNRFTANVKAIENHEIVKHIILEIDGTILKTIISKVPAWVAEGESVSVAFRELSVCIGTSCEGKVSIENRLSAVLETHRSKNSLTELVLRSRIGTVVALMTEDSFHELELKDGDELIMMLRGIDITLEPHFGRLDKAMGMKVAN